MYVHDRKDKVAGFITADLTN